MIDTYTIFFGDLVEAFVSLTKRHTKIFKLDDYSNFFWIFLENKRIFAISARDFNGVDTTLGFDTDTELIFFNLMAANVIICVEKNGMSGRAAHTVFFWLS